MSTFDRRTLAGSSLLALGLLFVAAVVLSGSLFRGARLDLTANKLYTLSDGTRNVVGKLEEPINVTFYFSDSLAQDAPQLRTYASRVRELLEEIAAASAGKVVLQVIDPLPFSEDEDRATAGGLQGVPIGSVFRPRRQQFHRWRGRNSVLSAKQGSLSRVRHRQGDFEPFGGGAAGGRLDVRLGHWPRI